MERPRITAGPRLRHNGSAKHGATLAEGNPLCDLLLQIAGRDTNRLPSVRRHVAVLDAALPHMSRAQAELARKRIKAFETKWGPLLPGSRVMAENDVVPPQARVAQWLSMRKVPERHLVVLYRAASCVWGGETSLSKVMDHAFTGETDFVLLPVGYDSFKEWMIQLRIAMPEPQGKCRPGSLCRCWVEEMMPSSCRDTSYAACLQLRASMKR